MRFPNHVSITRDFTMMLDYIPVIMTFHDQLLVVGPVVTPVPKGLCLETAAGMWWVPGYATGKHKLTTTVFHNHLTIALKGHDLGMMLPHIPIPPNDLMLPVDMLKSSRKAMFEAGEVKANGKPIACCTFIDWGLIPTPMKACSEIPALNVGCGMSVLLNSMIVGMHPIDMLAGWASVLFESLLGLVISGDDAASAVEPLTDLAPSALGALIRLAGQEWGGYAGDAGLGVPIGDGVELTVQRSGTDQRWSGGVELTQDLGIGDLHGSLTVTEGGPGDDGPAWEAGGGASVFSDSTYEGSINSEGETSSTVEHPGLEPSWGGGVLGPPTSGGGIASSGSNPLDGGFIPSMGDLPSL